MTAHAQSIPIDGLVLTFGRQPHQVYRKTPPQPHDLFLVIDMDLEASTQLSTENIRKFLSSWAKAIEHSNLPAQDKIVELEAMGTLIDELYWLWDYAEEMEAH